MSKLKVCSWILSLFSIIHISYQQLFAPYSPPQHHPCARQCDTGYSRLCKYTFVFENYYTMSKACFNCPYNVTDCYRPQCIAANGVTRLIYTTNVLMPGPIISVCENDTIFVTVENKLKGQETSVHWHGIIQNRTQCMDGVPYVTQCPINSYSSFQYIFPVTQSGTYFWHSHSAFQIVDGLAGLLIIRSAPGDDLNEDQYDLDLDEHAILVSDFNNMTGLQLYGFHYQVLNENLPIPSLLVNGRGQLNEFAGGIYTPLTQFKVDHGLRYRFRMANNVNSECLTVLSIEGHSLTIIATDGYPVKPYTVPAFISGPGQRIDFVVNANHSEGGNFWMKFQSYGNASVCSQIYGAANLFYNGSTQINLTKKYVPPRLNLTLSEMLYDADGLSSLIPMDSKIQTPNSLLQTYSVGAYPNNNSLDYNSQYYPWDSFNTSYQQPLFVMNNISMIYPPTPIIFPVVSQNASLLCDPFNNQYINSMYSSCINLLHVAAKFLVEIVLINTENAQRHHTFHLHGYAFRVVGRGSTPATEYPALTLLNLIGQGKVQRNYTAPPLRDGVIVQPGGYVILSFVANTLGSWLFHSQMVYYLESGMALVIQVGNPLYGTECVPPQFPTCGNYRN